MYVQKWPPITCTGSVALICVPVRSASLPTDASSSTSPRSSITVFGTPASKLSGAADALVVTVTAVPSRVAVIATVPG